NASGGGLLAGNGAAVTATAAAVTDTHIAGQVSAAGNVSVISRGQDLAHAHGEGVTAGVVGVGTIYANAEAGGTFVHDNTVTPDADDSVASAATKTYVAGGADVTAGGAVNVQTQTNDTASAHTQAPGGGAVVVLGAKSRAVADGAASSFVDSGAAVHAGSTLAVTAASTRSADAHAEGITVGVIAAVGVTQAVAVDGGTTAAYLADNTSTPSAADITAGGLSVNAL